MSTFKDVILEGETYRGFDRYEQYLSDYYNLLALQRSTRTVHDVNQGGEGFMDGFNRVINAGRKIGDKVVDLYTGEVGTAIRNAIPGTHPYSTKGFPGEKHQILFHSG